MARQFVVAVDLDGEGSHPAAWRAARHGPRDLLTPARQRRLVQAVERAGIDVATLADGPPPPDGSPDVIGRLAPIELAAAAVVWTDALVLAPTAPVVHTEPFHLSNQLSSLDRAARGRAGVVVDPTSSVTRARAFGVPPLLDPQERRAEASAVVDAVRRLWDSWQDDAIIADAATGRFLDRDRIHRVDAAGPGFSIRGPALLPRPPQGQVVVLAPAGTLDGGLVDVALVTGADERGLLAGHAPAARDAPRTFAEVEVVLDDAGCPAAERLAALDAATPWASSGRLRHVGSAADLTALLRRLATHFDGVRLHPAVLDVDLDLLGRAVLPALASVGTHRPRREPTTLRAALGLTRPPSRYAPAGSRVA